MPLNQTNQPKYPLNLSYLFMQVSLPTSYIKYLTTLTDDHLEVCLKLTTTSYPPDYATLTDLISSSDKVNDHECNQLYCTQTHVVYIK